MPVAPFNFALEMNRMRRETAAKLRAAAASSDPSIRRRAAIAAEVICSKPARDRNDEHRLTAEELGVGQTAETQ